MMASQYESTYTFSQSTQANDSGPSPAKGRDSYGLVPVTVKQISEASQPEDNKSNFVIDGVDVTNVTLVGLVSNKTVKNTVIGFTLDDGTGQIGCTRWVNDDFDTAEMEEINDGMYIRVNGKLGSSTGRRQIVAFSARPVANFDEVPFHFIECIHFHLQNSKTKGDATTLSQSFSPSPNTPVSAVSNGYQTAAPSSLFSDQLSTDGLKGYDRKVFDYLKQPEKMALEKGVHRDELAKQLKIPMDKILESIKFLEGEGKMYSTTDEFHFKAT